MKSFLARLSRGEALLADGAMGTQLFARGLAPGVPPEAVTFANPDWLVEIAREYIDAGADIVQTNTFGGSAIKLAAGGLADRTSDVNSRAVELARTASAGRDVFIAGECGPCGRLLAPYGDAAPDEVRASFELQLRALVAAGVDLVIVETMTDLEEASIAVRAAKAIGPAIPVIATMTFDSTPRGFFTIMGVDVARACRGLAAAGADVVGANCGAGSATMLELARVFRATTDLPVAIQPNAGLPKLVGGQVVHPETPAEMAERVARMLELGVSIVGGCCGTTPHHIRAFRGVLDDHRRRQGEKRRAGPGA